MTRKLESYAAGRWFTAEDEGRPLLDASTGEEVFRFSAQGLDLGAVTTYARQVGGPALRALTFHERAGILKALGKHLMEHVAEFHELSLRTGATKGDGMGDIEGGIGTLFASGSVGTRQLPNDTVYLDGDPIPLGRGGTFVGQHVYTSRPGVCVQINAFNFPVWGMLEKLGPAFMAGMPTIVKPAAQTSYVTEAWSARSSTPAWCPRARCSCSWAAPPGCSTSCRCRTTSRSPARRTPPGCCAPTPTCCTVACRWASRPTRSTARSSAPTWPPTTRSSTCSSRAWSPR